MKTETKKQHYLPFAYLKYFRCASSNSQREKATILRDDGTHVVEEKVVNQCYKTWFYRRENTQESEQGFQSFESDWDTVVSNARAQKDESALLFLQIVMYHFRNLSIRFQHDTMDRYEAVSKAVQAFISQKILHLPDGVAIADDPSHVTEFPWEVKLITMNSPLLFASDNPAVMSIPPSQDGYAPFFLPVSPNELLVGIDKSKYRFRQLDGSDHDAFIAGAFVAAQGQRYIYYHHEMPDALRNDLWKMITRARIQEHQLGHFSNSRFIPTHPIYGINPAQTFQFLEEVT